MDALELATRVARIEHRAAGSNAERRAALLLAEALRAASRRRRRTTAVQTQWVRPHHGPVHALCAAVGVAGSVVSVDHPRTGIVLAVVALMLLVGDLSGRFTPLRRLTFERATQNVVSRDPRAAPVRLVVTASVDAPVSSVLGRGRLLRAQARLRRALRGHLPGPYGVLLASLAAIAACAGARALGVEGPGLGAGQLVPTVLALLGLAAALDQSVARPPAAAANGEASAAATTVAVVAVLDADPPRHLAVDCVLAGAGGAHHLGLRRWLRQERRAGRRIEELAVLHLTACGAGHPVAYVRDGLALGLALHPRLSALAAAVGLPAHTARAGTGAWAARARRWPALAVGTVDDDGVPPRVGESSDTIERLDPEALAATRDAVVALVRALDADLARRLPADPASGQAPGDPGPALPPRPPVAQPSTAAWRRRPPSAPPPQAPPPPPTSARAARRAAASASAGRADPDPDENA